MYEVDVLLEQPGSDVVVIERLKLYEDAEQLKSYAEQLTFSPL